MDNLLLAKLAHSQWFHVLQRFVTVTVPAPPQYTVITCRAA